MIDKTNNKIRNIINALNWIGLRRYILANIVIFLIVLLAFLFFKLSGVNWANFEARYSAALLTINITTAIFAVTFAFSAYQLSPYRNIIRSIPDIQQFFTVVIFLISLLPFVALYLNYDWAYVIPLFTIPIVFGLSITLLYAIFEETDPFNLLKDKCSKKIVNQFLNEYSQKIITHREKMNNLEAQKIFPKVDRPIYLIMMRTPPLVSIDDENPMLEDPFNFITSLGLEAIKNNDIHTFELVTQKAYELMSIVSSYNYKDYKNIDDIDISYIDTTLYYHAREVFIFLIKAAYNDKTHIYPIKLLDNSELFIRKNFDKLSNSDNTKLINLFISILVPICYESIETNNMSDLYYCVDVISWIGYSALKNDKYNIATICSSTLFLLGEKTPEKGYINHSISILAEGILNKDKTAQDEWLSTISYYLTSLNKKDYSIKVVNIGEKQTISIEPNDINVI